MFGLRTLKRVHGLARKRGSGDSMRPFARPAGRCHTVSHRQIQLIVTHFKRHRILTHLHVFAFFGHAQASYAHLRVIKRWSGVGRRRACERRVGRGPCDGLNLYAVILKGTFDTEGRPTQFRQDLEQTLGVFFGFLGLLHLLSERIQFLVETVVLAHELSFFSLTGTDGLLVLLF